MTLRELQKFLEDEHLTLLLEYSPERVEWRARLRLEDQKRGGVVAVSSPALTLEVAITRAVEMWRHR